MGILSIILRDKLCPILFRDIFLLRLVIQTVNFIVLETQEVLQLPLSHHHIVVQYHLGRPDLDGAAADGATESVVAVNVEIIGHSFHHTVPNRVQAGLVHTSLQGQFDDRF